MQVIPIIWPILVCAFLTGLLLGWVLFVALPRMRRAEQSARAPRVRFRNVRMLPPTFKPRIVDADQQGARRNL